MVYNYYYFVSTELQENLQGLVVNVLFVIQSVGLSMEKLAVLDR